MVNNDPKKPDPPQAYLEMVMDLAWKAWQKDISEFRVMSNRNGASVMRTLRDHFSTKKLNQ